MENFNTWKTKIDKFSKNLSGIIWTREQMRNRSLQGGQSNRFKNTAPKLKATPKKVSAVLGKNIAFFLFASMLCLLLNHAQNALFTMYLFNFLCRSNKSYAGCLWTAGY